MSHIAVENTSPSDVPPVTAPPTLGVEELFFSTTDRRGVISTGNSVFVRVSGFSLEELVGSPHNMVRHPDMPGGVFRIMWDTLAEGRPVGAYVCNLTSDGQPYWVFAVISPIDTPGHEGYVSVRMAPRGALFDVAMEAYALAANAEHAALNMDGTSRRDAAVIGRDTLLQALSRAGFASYDEFMQAALPQEAALRGNLTSTVYARPEATGEIARVLGATQALDAQLTGLLKQLVRYAKLDDDLDVATAKVVAMAQRLTTSVSAAQAASEQVADRAPVLANVARVMAVPMTSAVTALEALPGDFAALRADIAALRFQISLATVYNDMASAFAAEVHDGVAPAAALDAVPLLCDVADACLTEMAEQVRRMNAHLPQAAAKVTDAGALLIEFRRFIGQWRHLVFRHANAELGEPARAIDEQISASWNWMEQLTALGSQAASTVVPFDETRLHSHLDAMRTAHV